MLDNLRRVLKPEGIGKWWDLEIPAFGGKTPTQMVEAGEARRVLEKTRSYLDPSFV